MGRAQKGKHHKRRRSWHRGRVEARRWLQVDLPDGGSGADPTGAPTPLQRGHWRGGDAL